MGQGAWLRCIQFLRPDWGLWCCPCGWPPLETCGILVSSIIHLSLWPGLRRHSLKIRYKAWCIWNCWSVHSRNWGGQWDYLHFCDFTIHTICQICHLHGLLVQFIFKSLWCQWFQILIPPLNFLTVIYISTIVLYCWPHRTHLLSQLQVLKVVEGTVSIMSKSTIKWRGRQGGLLSLLSIKARIGMWHMAG